jgi:ribosome-associated toxin RatA of RatAB toxin-antitoxin module
MRKVERSAIFPYSTEQMFDLVADIDSYSEFLTWCSESEVKSRTETDVIATLTLGVGGLSSSFTTHNVLHRPQVMNLGLEDGPFSILEGCWEFVALGEQGCKVNLTVEFEFSNNVQDMLLGKTFESICNQLIDAFVERARVVYDQE